MIRRNLAIRVGAGGIPATLALLLAQPGYASSAGPMPDETLAQKPIIVVARWKGPLKRHERSHRDATTGERYIDDYEDHTTLVIERVLRGNLAPGEQKLIVRGTVSWTADGLHLWSNTSSMAFSDVGDLKEPHLWFLDYGKSWDTTLPESRLLIDHYLEIQPLNLEPLYRILMRPDRQDRIVDLLDSSDPKIVDRALQFIQPNGPQFPFDWPYDKFPEFGAPRGKPANPLTQHKEAVWRLNSRKEVELRPTAIAIYASLAGQEGVPRMRSLLTDLDPTIRAIAIGFLVARRDMQSAPQFAAAARGISSPSLGCAVVERLAKWDSPKSVQALITFLESDGNEGWIDGPIISAVRARNELLKLTGATFPFDVRAADSAWKKARNEPTAVARTQTLKRLLGQVPVPVVAFALNSGGQPGILIRNSSGLRTTIGTTNIGVDLGCKSASGGIFVIRRRKLSARPRFVVLNPRQSIVIRLTASDLKDFRDIWHRMELSAPAECRLQLIFSNIGVKYGHHAWIGVLTAKFAAGWKRRSAALRIRDNAACADCGILNAFLDEISSKNEAGQRPDSKMLVDNRNLGSFRSSSSRIVLGDFGKVIAAFHKLERNKDYLLETQFTNWLSCLRSVFPQCSSYIILRRPVQAGDTASVAYVVGPPSSVHGAFRATCHLRKSSTGWLVASTEASCSQ